MKLINYLFQLVAIMCLVLVLAMFSNSLKDDPLPVTAEETRLNPDMAPGQTELEPMLESKVQPDPVVWFASSSKTE